MANNPYVNKVQKADGTTIIDITPTTAVASDVAEGKYFFKASGELTIGTLIGGGGKAIIKDTTDSAGGTIREITTDEELYLDDLSVTQNGTYNAPSGTAYDSVSVNVHTEPTLQTKSATYTPTESQQTATITADNGYDGLEEVDVTVNAISNTYVGSGITRRSSSDLTVSGATVTAPSGYYSASASKSVQTMTPSVSSTSAGQLWNSINATSTVQYINLPEGYNDTSRYARVYTQSGSVNTPTATKGTVSNHSVSVTPSVTSSAGYIVGGTKNGTAVTVSASELVSGTKTITENGTGIDVTNYANVDVNVDGIDVPVFSGTDPTTITCNKTFEQCLELANANSLSAIADMNGNTFGLTLQESSPSELVYTYIGLAGESFDFIYDGNIEFQSPSKYVNEITITENGTYSDSSGGVYDLVKVNVSGSDNNTLKKLIERTITTEELPSGLTSIGIYAFSNCTNLALTSLPSGVTSISNYAFSSCTSLALTSLPSGVTSIGSYAFDGCKNISLTSLPSGLTSISAGAFRDCFNLALTSLPDSITAINQYAFEGCSNLKTVSCNGHITTLPNSTFRGTSGSGLMALEIVRFPYLNISSFSTVFGYTTASLACQQLRVADIGSVNTISANAFANCYKLQTLVLRRTSAISALANVSAFLNTPMRGYNSLTGTVYVPSALISTYQTATNWKTLYDAGTINFVAIEGSEYEL